MTGRSFNGLRGYGIDPLSRRQFPRREHHPVLLLSPLTNGRSDGQVTA